MSSARTQRRRLRHERHRHLLVDLAGCPADVLQDERFLRETLVAAAVHGGATVVDQTFHRFEGGGVTGVVAVKESHLTIHTWPEHGYAAVDIFLCGPGTSPRAAADLLATRLRAREVHVAEQLRGVPVDDDAPPPAVASPPAAASPRMPLLYGVTLVVALCSLVYELLLAQTLSAILGNTVLRYSITIGCYLGALGVGALLCGSRPADPARRLVRIEIALSALGGLAVPLFHFLDAGQRFLFLSVPWGSAWDVLAPVGFLAATHVVILAVGLLSGFEVPLLLRLGEDLRPRSTNRVLGVDYFGSLLGSVLFPLVFLRTLGLIATGFVIGLLNAVAAALLILSWRPVRAGRAAAALGAVVAALVAGLVFADPIEQYFLKRFYFAEEMASLGDLVASRGHAGDIERHRSPYQTIDIVRSPQEDQWVYDAVSAPPANRPVYPHDVWLYLDRDYQVYSGSDAIYHEWFVHAPIQVVGRPPREVAVIGGGDGLVMRELLKYAAVRRLVHVELDPEMLRLSREHPVLSAMNGGADGDPRVEVALGDAFQWLRDTDDRFDAVFVDVPRARDYNLAMLYSREFYAMIRRHLRPGGFVALDSPDGSCDAEGNVWDVYYSTLRSAGFATVRPLVSRFDDQARRIVETAAAVAANVQLYVPTPSGGRTPLTDVQERQYVRDTMLDILGQSVQEFLVAFPDARAVDPTWTDFGIPLRALTPHLLALAFPDECLQTFVADRVNSIYRPTLPPVWWFAVPLA